MFPPSGSGLSCRPRRHEVGVLRNARRKLLRRLLPQCGCPMPQGVLNQRERMEAPPGFEPGMEVLQTSALPLGDGAARTRADRRHDLPGRAGRCGGTHQGRVKWSGKRDSNPRLRPWQGRTLPLSYSRTPQTTNNKRNIWVQTPTRNTAHALKSRQFLILQCATND